MTPQIGDWVRFMRDGKLVVGVVSYITLEPGGFKYAVTDCGIISFDMIYEIRKKP